MCVCLETWSSVLFTFLGDYSKWSLDSSCEKKNQVVNSNKNHIGGIRGVTHTKADVHALFPDFYNFVFNQCNTTIKSVRSDNALELASLIFFVLRGFALLILALIHLSKTLLLNASINTSLLLLVLFFSNLPFLFVIRAIVS